MLPSLKARGGVCRVSRQLYLGVNAVPCEYQARCAPIGCLDIILNYTLLYPVF